MLLLAGALASPGAAAQPTEDDWQPPRASADLQRAHDGSIYWTAERTAPEMGARSTLWRIEFDSNGTSRATQRIAWPAIGSGSPQFLGLTPSGGAWWALRCHGVENKPGCDQVARTDLSGQIIGWAPIFPGDAGAHSVDASGDLLWWRKVAGDSQPGRDFETVFERWRLRVDDLEAEPGAPLAPHERPSSLANDQPAPPWQIDRWYSTPTHWSEPERALDDALRTRRRESLKRLSQTGERSDFCGTPRDATIGPGVIAFSRIGCEESRFAVYRLGRGNNLVVLWDATLPTNPASSRGTAPGTPEGAASEAAPAQIRRDPEAPRFTAMGPSAVGPSGELVVSNYDSWRFHSREQEGNLVFFDGKGRIRGGSDVNQTIREMLWGSDGHLIVTEAAPSSTHGGEIVRRLGIDGAEIESIHPHPPSWDDEMRAQLERAQALNLASPLEEWLALSRWTQGSRLNERIAVAWADDPLQTAQRLDDRFLRQAAALLCERFRDSAPDIMLSRFLNAEVQPDRVLSDDQYSGARLVEAAGQAAWLVLLSKCFPTPESAPPEAMAVAQSWRSDERLRRYAEIALEVWTPGDERADQLWGAMRRIANRRELADEPLGRRVAEATDSTEASLLTGMFPKSRTRIEQGLRGDELDRGMAMEISSFVAQFARQGVLGAGSSENEEFVETLRAWSFSDHPTTADIGTLLLLGLVDDLDLDSPPESSALQAALRRSVGDPILLVIAEMNLQFAARRHLEQAQRETGSTKHGSESKSFLQWLGLVDADIGPWLRHAFDLLLEEDRRLAHFAETGEVLRGERPPRIAMHLLQAMAPSGQAELLRYLQVVKDEFRTFNGLQPGFLFSPGFLYHSIAGWIATRPEDWQEADLDLILGLAEKASDSREAECTLLAAVRLTQSLPSAIRERAEERTRSLIDSAKGHTANSRHGNGLKICSTDGTSI